MFVIHLLFLHGSARFKKLLHTHSGDHFTRSYSGENAQRDQQNEMCKRNFRVTVACSIHIQPVDPKWNGMLVVVAGIRWKHKRRNYFKIQPADS